MSSPATALPVKESQVWLLWLSIAVQQIVFLGLYGVRIPLIAISQWVTFVPVLVIWALYVLVPLLSEKRERKHALLRAYARTGWIFVVAAMVWFTSYIALSEIDGTPVSDRLMREFYEKKEANQRPERNAGAAPVSPSTPPAGVAHP